MFPPVSREATVNLAVQQIYNEYKWSWLFVDESLDAFTNLTKYFVSETEFPIKYIVGLEYDDPKNNTIELFPERSITQLKEGSCVFVNKEQSIFVMEEQEYTISYIKDYVFQPYESTPGLEIPIPNKCITALYYLVLSQLDLIDAQQLSGQPANNFNKYQYEMKNLKANDVRYDAQLIGANPQ